jgi:hypothetical protein
VRSAWQESRAGRTVDGRGRVDGLGAPVAQVHERAGAHDAGDDSNSLRVAESQRGIWRATPTKRTRRVECGLDIVESERVEQAVAGVCGRVERGPVRSRSALDSVNDVIPPRPTLPASAHATLTPTHIRQQSPLLTGHRAAPMSAKA